MLFSTDCRMRVRRVLLAALPIKEQCVKSDSHAVPTSLFYAHRRSDGQCITWKSSIVQKYQVLFILFVFKHILIYPSKTTLPCCVLYAGELFITKWHYTAEMEACQHHSAQVVVLTQRTPAPAYNAAADSPVCTGLQCRDRFISSSRL